MLSCMCLHSLTGMRVCMPMPTCMSISLQIFPPIKKKARPLWSGFLLLRSGYNPATVGLYCLQRA